jgi:hypothetical protein
VDGAIGVTAAVNVTTSPARDGLADERRAVVDPPHTARAAAGDALPAKATSPAYWAVIA